MVIQCRETLSLVVIRMNSADMNEIDEFHMDREKMLLDRAEYSDTDSMGRLSEENGEVLPLNECDTQQYYFSDSEASAEFEQPEDTSKAWGSSRKLFYKQSQETYSSEEGDELEEMEALALQEKMAATLTDADFQAVSCLEPVKGLRTEGIIQDLDKLSTSEKIQVVERNFPELHPLIDSFKKSFSLVLSTFLPSYKEAISNGRKQFIELLIHLNLCHSVNVMFYLLLKASRHPDTVSHPVVSRILSINQLISQLEDFDILSNVDKVSELNHHPVVSKGVVLPHLDPLTYYESMRKVKGPNVLPSESEHNVEFEVDGEKRPISYQISRNKGLTPKRRKEQRNPRVKHRSKFKKALIKRKGQVLPVQTELSRYGGESSGIRSNVAKSVKIS